MKPHMGPSRNKVCGYRGCGAPFVDVSPKNVSKFCSPEHRRREKLFRLGKEPTQFREDQDLGWRTCQSCRGRFLRTSGKSVRCDGCRDLTRTKVCRGCGGSYRDDTLKNTRRFCDSCAAPKTTGPTRAKVSDRLEEVRSSRVGKGRGGRLDDFATISPFTRTWWGRVGEMLFLHAYPDAFDAITEYGNTAPFDAQHRTLGRVSVKTAQADRTPHGRAVWVFQLGGVRANSDHAFLIGLTEDRRHVLHVWEGPSSSLPRQAKTFSPGSSEYKSADWERPHLVPVLERKLQAILGTTPTPRVRAPKVEYERAVLGRLGEAVYGKLYPSSTYVAGDDPLAPFDFRDPDQRTVNVRLRRRDQRNRWTFFRSSDAVNDYFFIGVDARGETIEAVFRVPSEAMPPHGFSVAPEGDSKWNRYRVEVGAPLSLFDFVGAKEVEATQVRISSLSEGSVAAMSEDEKERLVQAALRYHRFFGFPFPSLPSDKRLEADVRTVLRYRALGNALPPDNAGLATCSAYMPHRFDVRNADADFSAFGAFHDDARLTRALRFCLRGRTPDLSRRALRSVLTALNRTPTSFRPTAAKALIDHYCVEGGIVFDPCAGWGGRLFGALVSGRSYVGVEPNPKTVDALFRLGSRLLEHLDLDRGRLRLIPVPIQEVGEESFLGDFALTSPPYWRKELYDGTPENESLASWYETFLLPLFRVTYRLTGPTARFAVNVSDGIVGKKAIPLEALTVRAAQEAGYEPEATWRMDKASFGNQGKDRFEPVLVFRKR